MSTSSTAGTSTAGTSTTTAAAASTLSAEPYFAKQWALYNDGTFTVDSGTSNTMPEMPTITKPEQGGTNNWNNRDGFRAQLPGGRTGGNTSSRTRRLSYTRYATRQITAVADIDIDAPEAWAVVGDSGRDVVIAVIDTGIDYTHEDLSNAIWTNTKEVAGDGIDNDGNGYIDDIYGWDFYNNQAFKVTTSTSEYDHGTHVAGIIAASAENEVGIAGINANDHVKIMTLKVLGGNNGSGTTDAVVNAIKYAESMGASICNLSFGTGTYDASLEAAIKDSGMLFICAAGNATRTMTGDNTDNNPIYPASFDLDNIISVANVTYDGTLDTTSDYGTTSVDLAAPGSYIYSTVSGNSYEYMTGTSMAAPMVTAVAAMVYSYQEDLSLSEVKDKLLSSVTKLTSLDGKVATGGMLNAYNAVTSN
jgi:subtilisin family serine protease